MKANLYSSSGDKKSQIELPKIFSTKVREDLVQKYLEVDRFFQPYSVFKYAGLRQSAAGTISHKRHTWKGHYGKGISRVPRKTMWRRGTQFYWVGATVPGARGGRKAHPPKGIGQEKKLNKKEISLAINSGFAATAHPSFIIKRYDRINQVDSAPFVIESLPEKTKVLVSALKKMFGEYYDLAFKTKQVRAGKGKSRGRKYKSTAGVLIVTSESENRRFKGFDLKSVKEVSIADLYPLGRLTIYTHKALEEMSKEKTEKEVKEKK